jgi:two-component system chemotaxis response regulator CheY
MALGRVLVVDDEGDIRKMVKMVLTKAGYDVIEAEDGEKGIAAVRAGDNPLLLNTIICDLAMPKVGGMEAVTYFRSQFPSVPVIVLSGTGTIDKAKTLFKQGVVEFLSKPVEPDKLVAAVSKAVQQSGYKDDFKT